MNWLTVAASFAIGASLGFGVVASWRQFTAPSGYSFWRWQRDIWRAPIGWVNRFLAAFPLLWLPLLDMANPGTWITVAGWVWLGQSTLLAVTLQGFRSGIAARETTALNVDMGEFMHLAESYGIPPQEIERLIWKEP